MSSAAEGLPETWTARPSHGTGFTGRTLRGDLLSCYTAAVAVLMETRGLSHRAVLGGQPFLAVRREGTRCEVVHQHTPLTGDGESFTLPLVRRGAADAEEAGRAVAAAARRDGAVIVTGATDRLPWLAGAAPAPHWFAVTCRAGRPEIDDVFAWSDDQGDFGSYRAPVEPHRLGPLAACPAPPDPAHRARERLALGGTDAGPAGRTELPYQWLELDPEGAPGPGDRTDGTGGTGGADGMDVLSRMLHRTAAAPGLAQPGWLTGGAAAVALADLLEEAGRTPEVLAVQSDLWVAARGRALFREVLRDEATALLGPTAAGLGDWLEAHVLPPWTGVVRAVRYNALRVRRGHPPQRGMARELRRLGALEDELPDRLRDVLASAASAGGRQTSGR
ncbi:hypothetical protein AB0D11_17645 [Streptomyces monashensis]|uniref:hypothetical protein n=1 Tax=Streptomyces monashensis TaxID=1678012 RepID=UPI0033EC4CAC